MYSGSPRPEHQGNWWTDGGTPYKTYLSTQSGPKWMTEKDQERHFAPDCMLLISGSSSETLKRIIAINFHGVTPFDLCEKLSIEYGIQTRAGCSCAGPYGQDLFGISESNAEKEKPSWLRISLNYTHSKEDIKYLIDALRVSVKVLKEK